MPRVLQTSLPKWYYEIVNMKKKEYVKRNTQTMEIPRRKK